MKQMKYIIGLMVCTFLCASCDNRKDWWMENDEKPTYHVSAGQVDSTKYDEIDGIKYYEVTIGPGETKKIHFDNITQSYERGFSTRYEICATTAMSYLIDMESDLNDQDLRLNEEFFDISYDKNSMSLVFRNKVNSKEMIEEIYALKKEYRRRYQLRFKELEIGNDEYDEFFCYINTTSEFSTKVYLINCVGNETVMGLKLKVYDNRPPQPNIQVTRLKSGNMEYEIKSNAVDPDGHEVIAYEYCIDGNIQSYMQKAMYESRIYPNVRDRNPDGLTGYELSKPEKNSDSHMAKEMVYIPSTTLSSIKHAFQSSGEHVIWVRAKDQFDLWSAWTKYEINL